MRNNAFTLAAAAAILTAVLGVTGCPGPNDPGPNGGDNEVAATVNGVNIPVSKIDQIIDLQLKQGGPNAPQLTPIDLAAARLQVLDGLIQEEAIFQRAQKENVIPTDDEVKQAIQTQIQQSGMSQDDYQKYLKDVLGKTDEEFKADAKRKLAIQKLQEKVTATIPTPTDAEMQKYFDENKAQLVAPRGLDLSDIIVDPKSNNATDDAIGEEAAKRKADEIAAQLRANTDFATLARQRSEDRSALQGGSIGFFAEAQLQQTFPADIAQRFFTLQVGQITEPIRSADGRYHIFKLNAKREQNQELTFDQVKTQIAQTITDQRKQIVLSALLIDALSSATVRNNIANQIVAHPDTFGALRPSPLTQPRPAQPAPAAPAPAKQPEAQPGAPVNANKAEPATKK